MFLSTYDNISGTWINIKDERQKIVLNQKDKELDIKLKFCYDNLCDYKFIIGKGTVDFNSSIIRASFNGFNFFKGRQKCSAVNIVLNTNINIYNNYLDTTSCRFEYTIVCDNTSNSYKKSCNGRWE